MARLPRTDQGDERHNCTASVPETIFLQPERGDHMRMSLPVQSPTDRHEDLDERSAHLLEQAVEKLVRYGQKVGVTPVAMISLLDTGISIDDLLAFLASKTSGAA